MTDAGQNHSLRRIGVVLLVLVLLIVLVMSTCRRRPAGPREEVATVNSAASAPASPLAGLRSGLEVIPPIAGALITVRDQATGQTIQIPRADYSPQAVDREFARISHQQKPEPAASSSSNSPVTGVAPAHPTGTSPPVPANPGAGVAAVPKTTEVVARPVVEENLPDFVPLYPGATTIKIASSRDHGRLHGDYEFATSDAPDSIGKFYAKGTGDRGLMIIVNVAGKNSNGATFTLIAEDTAAGKSLSLTATVDARKSRGSIEFVAK